MKLVLFSMSALDDPSLLEQENVELIPSGSRQFFQVCSKVRDEKVIENLWPDEADDEFFFEDRINPGNEMLSAEQIEAMRGNPDIYILRQVA